MLTKSKKSRLFIGSLMKASTIRKGKFAKDKGSNHDCVSCWSCSSCCILSCIRIYTFAIRNYFFFSIHVEKPVKEERTGDKKRRRSNLFLKESQQDIQLFIDQLNTKSTGNVALFSWIAGVRAEKMTLTKLF